VPPVGGEEPPFLPGDLVDDNNDYKDDAPAEDPPLLPGDVLDSPEGEDQATDMTTDVELTEGEEPAQDLASLLSLYADSRNTIPNLVGVLRIANYGNHSTGMLDDYKTDGTEYNLEWEGHTWSPNLSNDYSKSCYFDNRYGIKTVVYSYSDKYDTKVIEQGGAFYLNDAAQDAMKDLPRIPNMEFEGWYVYPDAEKRHAFLIVQDMPNVSSHKHYFTPGSYYKYEGKEADHPQDEEYVPYTWLTNDMLSGATLFARPDDQWKGLSGSLNDYIAANDIAPGDGQENDKQPIGKIIPLVGKWVPSSNATATDLKLTTYADGTEDTDSQGEKIYRYQDGIESMTGSALAEQSTGFDSNFEKYFVRVPHEADQLRFAFTTYEPGSTVDVIYNCGLNSKAYRVVGTETTSYYAINDTDNKITSADKYIIDGKGGLVDNPNRRPTNFAADFDPGITDVTSTGPARKVFTLDDSSGTVTIPLETCDKISDSCPETYDKVSKSCNVITFTVTAPDGVTTKTYTVYVQRLADPAMTQDSGNTAYGLFKTESEINENFDLSKAQDGFDNGYSVYEKGVSKTNGGFVYTGKLPPEAWGLGEGDYNYDQDETAIVIYQNSAVKIPSYTIIDALGYDRAGSYASNQVGEGSIDWTLEMTAVNKLLPWAMTADLAKDNPDGVIETPEIFTKEKAANKDMIDLRGKNIKPGVYTLTYTYEDPYDGKTHNFDRPVIVLPLPGDVDMDGEVTVADGVMIEKLLNDQTFRDGLENDRVKRLYWYRVCDVNGDRVVTDADVTKLVDNGFDMPFYGSINEEEGDLSSYCRHDQASADYYKYLPLPDADPNAAPEREAPLKNTTAGLSQLSVKYLGVRKEETEGGYSYEQVALEYDAENPPVFWMAVQLSGVTDTNLPEELRGDLTTFTFTLNYDSAYVTPYVEHGNWADYIISINEDSFGNCILLPSSGVDLPTTCHTSKSKIELKGLHEKIRELRFSVKGNIGALKDEGITLLIPFTLTAYPSRLLPDGATSALLVEATLGMRDFTITTNNGVGAWCNRADHDQAHHFLTKNLAACFNYVGSDPVPMGTPHTFGDQLKLDGGKNPVYGEPFTIRIGSEYGVEATSTLIDGAHLPAGVEYLQDSEHSGGMLTGTPRETGSFSFQLHTTSGDKPFQFYVDKAPLTLTVQDVQMYYGEKAENSTEKRFTYNVDEIKDIDLVGKQRKDLKGTQEELDALLDDGNYKDNIPDIGLYLESSLHAEPVNSMTPPGDNYAVIIQGGSCKNYYFRYATTNASNETTISTEAGYANLKILPRPITVTKVTKDPLGEILESANVGQIEFQTASYRDSQFKVTSPASMDGKGVYQYNGIPLTSTMPVAIHGDDGEADDITLVYNVNIPGLHDTPLIKPEERRDAIVTDLALPGTGATIMAGHDDVLTEAQALLNSCYQLLNAESTASGRQGWSVLSDSESKNGQVLVRKQSVTGLAVVDNGQELKMRYTYGETLELGTFHLELTPATGEKVTVDGKTLLNRYEVNGTNDLLRYYINYGLLVQWVENSGDQPTPVQATDIVNGTYYNNSEKLYPDVAYIGQRINVAEHNGHYICVSVANSEVAPIYIGPFQVSKRELTLTPTSAERYYGEADPTMDISFRLDQLTTWDRDKAGNNTPNLGLLTALDLDGYKGLEMAYRVDRTPTADKVGQKENVGTYYFVVSGAQSNNYEFKYSRTDAEGTDSQVYADYGYNTLKINKRPILITQINAPAAVIPSDSEEYSLYAEASVSSTVSGFQAVKPEREKKYILPVPAEDGYGGMEYQDWLVATKCTLEEPAILVGDVVTVSYQVELTPDSGKVTAPWWDITNDTGIRNDIPAEIERLKLTTKGASSNYELIYVTSDAAGKGLTTNLEGTPTTTQGTVRLREIASVLIIGTPKGPKGDNNSVYTYGGDDGDNGQLLLDGLVVEVGYTDGSKTKVAYSEFSKRGLTVHWKEGNGISAPVKAGDRLYVSDSGKTLTVKGQALTGHPAIYAIATEDTWKHMTVTVAPRPLTLKVDDQIRVYGEKNGTYTFSFDPSKLASWDQEVIQGYARQGSVSDLGVIASSEALSVLAASYNSTFVGPTFRTSAIETTNVGKVPLYLEGSCSLENYQLILQSGSIEILRRPLIVKEIKKDPLFTVPTGAREKHQVTCYQRAGEEEQTQLVFDVNGTYYQDSYGISISNSTTLLDGDMVAVQFEIEYMSTELSGSWLVSIKDYKLTQGTQNYVLVGNQVNRASAEVRESWITAIRIKQPPQMQYTYGAVISLSSMLVEYDLENQTGIPGNPESMGTVRVFYWDSETLPTQEQMRQLWLDSTPDENDPSKINPNSREARTGDKLSVSKEKSLAHDGARLLVVAKCSADENSSFVCAVTEGALKVEPLLLGYRLTAENKIYDTTAVTGGTVQLTKVQSGDKIWLNNGVDYSDSNNALPADYKFSISAEDSGANTFSFRFATIKGDPSIPNVDGADVGSNKLVEVYGLRLSGPDRENYRLGTVNESQYGPVNVLYNTGATNERDGAPKASVTQGLQQTPGEILGDRFTITLTIDQRTNTVKVIPMIDGVPTYTADAFRNRADLKNDQLHLEYRLVYLNADGERLDDFKFVGTDDYRAPTAFRDSPYFGGENVGQTAMEGDDGFGLREWLARGGYVMAGVRLSATDNYKASQPTPSTLTPQADVAASLEDLPQAEEGERQPERKDGPVVKTYTYRIELWAIQEAKNETTGETEPATKLADVIFTDISLYDKKEILDQLTENVKEPIYSGYYWDAGKTAPLEFDEKFDLTRDIVIELPEGGEKDAPKVPVIVNERDGKGNVNLKVYVDTIFRTESSGGPRAVYIEPDALQARLGDEPFQLSVRYQPTQAKSRMLYWSSSDETVVTVSKDGLVTFVGVGEATITVRTTNNKTCSIPVTVTEAVTLPYADTMFNAGYTEPYMEAPQGIFRPDEAMTRRELVVVVERFFQECEKISPIEGKDYEDLPEDDACNDAVDTLTRWQIVNGVDEENFAPDRLATRAEMSAILSRMLLLELETDPAAPHAFRDTTPDKTWAWAYIDALAAAGITNGTGDGCYSPDDPVTRAQVATFFARILATKIDISQADLLIPIDVPADHWAYESILRAVNTGVMPMAEEWIVEGETL